MMKVSSLKNIISLYSFIFVVWGFYRFLVPLPAEVSEVLLKPLVWLVPLFLILKKEGSGISSLGWTGRNIFKSIYLAVGLGVLFAIEGAIVNSIKYGGSFSFLNLFCQEQTCLSLPPVVMLGALGISFATAVSEETVFRGFIFKRLAKLTGEWKSSIFTSIAWSAVHLPITIFVFKYDLSQIVIFLLLTFLFGIASSFVFARSGNILSSVLLHVFWEWPIILFR